MGLKLYLSIIYWYILPHSALSDISDLAEDQISSDQMATKWYYYHPVSAMNGPRTATCMCNFILTQQIHFWRRKNLGQGWFGSGLICIQYNFICITYEIKCTVTLYDNMGVQGTARISAQQCRLIFLFPMCLGGEGVLGSSEKFLNNSSYLSGNLPLANIQTRHQTNRWREPTKYKKLRKISHPLESPPF